MPCCVAFHPNPSLLASGSDDASVRVWDIASAKCVRLLCHHGHASAVSCVAVAPHGLSLASGGDDKVVLLWHLPSARLLARLNAHATPLWSLAFSQEGAHLASTASDCTLAVWDAKAAFSAAEGAAADAAPAGEGALLITRLHTKFTPVVAVGYTRTNVLLATGAFNPPPNRPAPKAS